MPRFDGQNALIIICLLIISLDLQEGNIVLSNTTFPSMLAQAYESIGAVCRWGLVTDFCCSVGYLAVYIRRSAGL